MKRIGSILAGCFALTGSLLVLLALPVWAKAEFRDTAFLWAGASLAFALAFVIGVMSIDDAE